MFIVDELLRQQKNINDSKPDTQEIAPSANRTIALSHYLKAAKPQSH